MLNNNKEKMGLKKWFIKEGINFGIVKAKFYKHSSGKLRAKFVKWIDGSEYSYKQFTSDKCLECKGTCKRTTIKYGKLNKTTNERPILKKIGDKCNVCLGTGIANWKRNQSIKKEEKKGRTNYKNLDGNEVVYYCMDTYNYAVLDKDNEDFAKHFEDILPLLRNAPYLKSRTKRLPHYILNLKGENIPTRLQFLNSKKDCIADLLKGQASWYRMNDKVYNVNNPIPTFNFKDFNKYTNPYWNMDKKTNPPIEQTKPKPEVKLLPTAASLEPKTEVETYEWDKEFVRELLNLIDLRHWENTNDWLSIGYNLKWCYGDKAFTLFNRFSGIASNYNEADVLKYWNDKINPKFGHINNLYKFAKRSNRSGFYYFIKKHHLPMSLLEHKKEPFDKRHLKFLCSRLQPSTKLENYLGEAEKYYESDAERKMYCKRISNKFVNAVCEYLNQYLFIVNGSERLYFRRDYNENGYENYEEEVCYKNKNAMIEMWDSYMVENEFIKRQPVSKLWLDYEYRMTYDKFVFEPGKFYQYDIDKKNVYNSWDGWCFKFEEDFEVDEELIKDIVYHFKNVIFNNNEELFEYYMKIIKMILIGKKSGIGLGLSSLQGTGKNFIFDYLAKKIFGYKYYSYFNNLSDLTGKFTSMLNNKVLVVCDELGTWSGDMDTATKLKGMITNPDQKKELKGKDAIMIKDFSNYVFFSNYDNFLKVEGKGDRRYCVGEVNAKHKGDREYFNNLGIKMGFDLKVRNLTPTEKQEATIRAKHFFHYLMNRSLVGFNHEKIPKTELRVNQEVNSVPLLTKFGRWLINQLKKQTDKFTNVEDFKVGPKKYNHYGSKSKYVYHLFKDYCDEFGYTNKFEKKDNDRQSVSNFAKAFLAKNRKYFKNKRLNVNHTSIGFILYTDKNYKDNQTWFTINKAEKIIEVLDNTYSFDKEQFEYYKDIRTSDCLVDDDDE